MLKMFTGDVCGDGTSFTVPGRRPARASARRRRVTSPRQILDSARYPASGCKTSIA
jgi:hypothetical protein